MNTEKSNFDLPFLQTISDWQIGSNSKRASRLKTLCASLPEKYRKPQTCYRKIDLGKKHIWDLVAEDFLPEKISSWTLDNKVAEAFKGGVPEVGYQGVILTLTPLNAQVIVDLSALYQAPEFLREMEKHKGEIKNYSQGAGKYQDKQIEIVLEVSSVSQEDIFSLGGYSSSFEELVELALNTIYGPHHTPEQREEVESKAEKLRAQIGARWLTQEATRRVLNRTKPKAEALAAIKRSQDNTK